MKRLLFTIKFYTFKKALGVQLTGILHSAPVCCLGILFATLELAQPYKDVNTNSTKIYIDVAFFVFLWYIIGNTGTSSTL